MSSGAERKAGAGNPQVERIFPFSKSEKWCYRDGMLKGQDIVVLVAVIGEDGPTIPALAERIGSDLASVHRSLLRLEEVRLLREGRRVNLVNCEELLVHALRYMFPAKFSGESRGVPTAWAAPALASVFASDDGPPPVWPSWDGEVRGIAVEPLYKSVPEVARRDPELYRRLAFVDALRFGEARHRREAERAFRAIMFEGAGA